MFRKIKIHFVISSLTSICISCSDWEVSELYALKIEGSSKILYKYDAWGGRDSHLYGFTLLDSIEKFNINSVVELPFSYLQAIPNAKEIKGIADDQSGYTETIQTKHTPIKIDTKEIKGIKINTSIYQYKGYTDRLGGLETYIFGSFKETRDSLSFYNLDDTESVSHTHLDSLKIQKTNIFIGRTKQNKITRLIINDLKISEKGEFISNTTYFLKPKFQLTLNNFSNIGIFKPVESR